MFSILDSGLHLVGRNQQESLNSKTSQFKTPFYVYDKAGIEARAEEFKSALPKNSKVFFAMKANNNSEVLKLFLKHGIGVDVVSRGEMVHALSQGFLADQIVFSGVAKTVEDIRFALEKNVFQLNVESEPELNRIILIAKEMRKKAAVALRVNPDVDAETHPYIKTGFRENKFGVDFADVPAILETLKKNKNDVQLVGITLHIGSQIRDEAPFREAALKSVSLYKEIEAQGFELKTFDMGGGVGIDYRSDNLETDSKEIKAYGKLIQDIFKDFKGQLLFEPGRILIARFGALVTEVQYLKKTPYKNFLIVDAGMNCLLRPSLYQAYHRIVPLDSIRAGKVLSCDVVGPICESTDTLGFDRSIPENLKAGDRIAVLDAGAYGRSMSSEYNMHELPKEYIL